jgi:tetratricopeptide (TPR) repeat protein
VSPLYQRALILHQQGRHADAEKELRQALAGDPHDPLMHAMLALCLTEQLRYRDATAEAEQAIGLAPDLPQGHYAMAKVMFDRQRFGEAIDSIRQAIELDSYDPDHFALLSAIRMQQRAWPAALEAAEKALELDPQHPGAVNLRATALVQLGRRADAADTLGDALARDPENDVTHANQGWALLHRGEPRKALEHFREALRLNPDSEWARAGIVEALKAKNFIYRWMLLYFLYMSRLSGRTQMMIMIGGYVGYRIAIGQTQTNPNLAPILWPLVIAYIIFAVMTWLSAPLFNLLLRLSKFGRLVLSREQTITSTIVGVLLAGALASVVLQFALGNFWFFLPAIVLGLLIAPVSMIYLCEKGWPRYVMVAATLVLAALGAAGAGLLYLEQIGGPERLLKLGAALFQFFTYGVLLSQFFGQALTSARVQR